MTRTNAREIVAQLVYEMGFRDDDAAAVVREHLDPDYYATLKDESDAYQDRPTGKQAEYIQSTLCGIRERQEELDGYISKYAIGWNLHRISRLTKAAMRLARFEMQYVPDVPTGVAINECVELTRKYEDDEVVAFVNGILRSAARALEPQKDEQQ